MTTYTQTTCPYCGCGCEFFLLSEGDRLVGVAPVDKRNQDRSSLCIKGWNAWQFVQDPHRLRTPMVRRDGELQPATWEEAIRTVVERIGDLQTRYGKDCISFLSSAKMTNEENYAFMRLVRAGFGTNNIDHCARL
jgi:predicted molibdopterin-dependent oxidoreductase YjgC